MCRHFFKGLNNMITSLHKKIIGVEHAKKWDANLDRLSDLLSACF